jgi:hypothetical protein
MGAVRIGIDFGGTKIEAAALNSAGEFLLRRGVSNPGNYDASLAAVHHLPNIDELYVRLPDNVRAFVFSDVWDGRISRTLGRFIGSTRSGTALSKY